MVIIKMSKDNLIGLNKETHKYQSFIPQQPIYIISGASVVSEKEGEGPLGKLFDIIEKDIFFGGDNWEEAESALQKQSMELAIKKAGINENELQLIFAGDLLAQSIASSFGLMDFSVPIIGVYGACSNSGLSLYLGAMALSAGIGDYVGCVTSSHFSSAEKEFRFPSAYGNQRPLSAHWTVTGSGAFILAKNQKEDSIRLTGFTAGQIVDFGLKENLNMGACMAPAAADTIYRHFKDFESSPADYDKIITGDLGRVGQKALIDLLSVNGYDISNQHLDCGIEIYDYELQDAHAGGSGCGCSAVVLAGQILKNIREGVWKRVLFVPTGALLSRISYNEGQTVPGIAHAVVLEK
ncbi:MAG: stage V sporulation protein AD [Lachnospiraceae bacterium]|nr:stage V sporulation protein AD [Lachnospiraceae bacterium]